MNTLQYEPSRFPMHHMPMSETIPQESIDVLSAMVYGSQKDTLLGFNQVRSQKTQIGIFDNSVYQDVSELTKTWYEAQNQTAFGFGQRMYANIIWLCELQKRLQELLNLPVGWDGYQGVPTSKEVANVTTKLLVDLYQVGTPAPSLIPGSDGSLQMEWHVGEYDLEIDILNPNWIEIYRCDLLTGEEESFELKNDFSKLSSWISDLKRTIT